MSHHGLPSMSYFCRSYKPHGEGLFGCGQFTEGVRVTGAGNIDADIGDNYFADLLEFVRLPLRGCTG